VIKTKKIIQTGLF